EFDVIYCVFATFFSLLTQEDQIACMRGSAKHLARGGKLLIEIPVPDHRLYGDGNWRTIAVEDDGVIARASRHDLVKQRIDSNIVHMVAGQPIEIVPIRMRYVHIAELDLMARVAGLELAARWRGFGKRPFRNSDRDHISVYRRTTTSAI